MIYMNIAIESNELVVFIVEYTIYKFEWWWWWCDNTLDILVES